jgi:hypothetical protein
MLDPPLSEFDNRPESAMLALVARCGRGYGTTCRVAPGAAADD